MDAALVTRMFNVGYSVKSEPPKDVLVKKDSDFKDVLSKNMKDVKSEDNKASKDVKKEDTEKIKTDENEDIDKKDVERKDKKDDKKVKDSEDNETEKINGLIEQRLENVKNEQDLDIKVEEVEKIDIEIKDVDLQEDENIGFGENIDEVGPQSVETEKITLNEFEKLESKLDSLSEKLGRTNEDINNKLKTDEAGEEEPTEAENEEDAFSSVNINEDVNYADSKDVEDKTVKNKESKIKITDFRGSKTFNDEFKMTEMDVKNENIEIPKFDITGTNNVIMSKADKLQEQIDVLKQITEKVDVNILEDKSEMLIKLKPDNLGKVTMQISVENGNISAKFLAESQKVKEILESNMQELKDQLAKQGMAVQEMSVSVGNDNRERQMFEGRNFGTFNRHSRINRIENNSYSINGEVYDDANDENLAHYWPDSTVSFSA